MIKTKVEGNILIITFLISSLIVTLGIGITRILGKELVFTQQLLWSERAHYAAESGIEQSLLWLNEEPVEYIEDQRIILDADTDTFIDLNIENNVSEFSFIIPPDGNRQLILRRDEYPESPESSGAGTNIQPVNDFTLFVEESANAPANGGNGFNWKVQCPSTDPSVAQTQGLSENVRGWAGNNTITSFLSSRRPSNADWNECYLTFTNLNTKAITGPEPEKNLTVTLSTSNTPPSALSPHASKIVSEGVSSDRVKRIEFTYLKKNLSSVFNFGGYFVQD